MGEYVTVATAAASLDVSAARIHQLVAAGVLVAAPLPPGRLKQRPRTAYIDAASVDAERRMRQSRSASTTQNRAKESRNSLYEAKIRMDQAREELRAERARSRKLARILTQMAQLVESSIAQSDAADAIADSYSEALSHVLGPNDPRDLSVSDADP